MAIVATSAASSTLIYSGGIDEEFIYVGFPSPGVVTKLRRTNLSKVVDAPAYGGHVNCVNTDGRFIYICGATATTINKITSHVYY